jgi:flagellar M-ring protein FliF
LLVPQRPGLGNLVAVLDADFAKSIGARARTAFMANRRMAILAGGAVAATFLALMLLWSRDPDYSVLYAGLSGEQGGRAIAELQKLNIPYRITEGGRVITVPTGQLGQARLQLAARGVPKTEGDGWGLLDNEALGVSPFIEQVHYVRGLEANLSHTVGELDGVLSAQVTLAMPKRTGFLADEPKPSASVLLRLAPGARMSGAQVAGVVGLIASSVPGLAREDVTVVDQDGKVLSAKSGDDMQAIPAQLAVVEQINTRYARLIDDLLAPVVGQGNFRVSVDADIDFAQSKQSLVRYGQGHILSQDQTIREGGEGVIAGGVPGALSNRPPENPTASTAPPPAKTAPAPAPAAEPGAPETHKEADKPSGPRESHAITNYDIDKTVQYLQDAPWKLQAISVAVLLNNATGAPIPAERVQSIKKLVESVIGVGARHEVTVVDLPFNKAATVPTVSLPLWKEPWVQLAVQNAALAIAGLLALFGGLFPLLRWLRSRPAPELAVAMSGGARDGAPRVSGGSDAPHDFSGANADSYAVDVDAVRKIVANDPGRTAQVIKEWISSGIPGNQQK